MGLQPWTRARASRRHRGCPLGVLLLLGNGCSWAFVQKPTSEELASRRPPECTRSVAAPVVDTAFATGFLILGVAALTHYSRCVADHEGFCELDYDVAIAMGLVATPFILSGIHGYTATTECRELERGYAGCFTGVEHSCRSLDRGGDPTRLAVAASPDR